MADLNVVYRIAADITGLQQGVNRAAKATEGLESLALKVGGAFAGMFTVSSAIAFGKVLLADADALQKLADKTGVSLQGLQRFQIAGDDAGNTIEQLTAAISMMENRLASGDKSAVAALQSLGLSLQDLQRLSPENQFIALSDAIRGIKDPTEQTRIAMDLFGRSGAEVLPTLKRGFDDLKGSAVGMSDETIRALDKLGDQMTSFWRSTKAFAAEALVATVHFVQDGMTPMGHAIGNATREMEAMADTAKRMADAIKPVSQDVAAPFKVITAESPQVTRWLKEQDEHWRKVAQATEAHKEAVKRWHQAVTDSTVAMNLSVFTLNRYGAVTLPAVTSSLQGAIDAVEELDDATRDLLTSIQHPEFARFGGTLEEIGEHVPTEQITRMANEVMFVGPIFQKAEKAGMSFGTRMRGLFSDLATILDQGKGKWVEFAETIVETTDAVINRLSQGDIFGAFVAGITGGAKAIAGIFRNNVQIEVNKTREAFVQAAGGLDKLNQRAAAAGVTLTKLLDARNPEQYKKAIDELTAAFQFQDDAMRFLDDTVKKYGFTIEELGPKFAQQQLTKQAFDLEKEFRALEAAGIDVSTISVRMKDAINEYLQAALKTGSAVPESMREILQQLANMGLLTDENGNAITDLEAAGVKFSKTLDQQFADLITTIQKLVDAIERDLGGAIKGIPSEIRIDGRIDWHVDPVPPIDPPGAATGGLVTQDGIQRFAAGGVVLPFRRKGTDTVPAMLTPGEMVLNRSQQHAIAELLEGTTGRSVSGGGVTIGRLEVNVTATPETDVRRAGEVFKEMLRTDSTVYQAISTVARRAVP